MKSSPSPHSNQSIKEWFSSHRYLIGILFLQMVVCGIGLFQHPFWVDEAYSAVIARKPFAAIHHAMVFDAGPPLYYDILHFWRMVWGESESALRLFSLLCSCNITFLIYFFCMNHFNKETAIISTMLWALSPLSVFYAIEARNYTLFALLTTAYLICGYSFLLYQKNLWIALFTIVFVFLLYTHNTALFLIPAFFMASLIIQKQLKPIVLLLTGVGIALLVYIPWMGVLLQQLENTQRIIGWIQAFWTWKMIGNTFTAFIPGGYVPLYMDIPQLHDALQWFLYGSISVLLCLGVYNAVKESHRLIFFLIPVFILVLIFPYFASYISSPTYLAGRTDFMVFPVWCMMLGYSVSKLPYLYVKNGVISLFLIISFVVVGLHFFTPKPKSEEELIKTIKYHAMNGDVVICTGLTRPIAEYKLDNEDVLFLSYPSDMEEHLAHLNEAWYFENFELKQNATDVLNQAVELLEPNRKILLIWSERSINQPLKEALESERFNHLHRNEYTHPRMGLSRLNEPLSIWILQRQ